MSRRDKLIAKIRARPVEADFRDVHNLLIEFGWTFDRERGSHVTYEKPGELSLTISKVGGRKVKRVYIDLVCQWLGLDELDDK